MRGTMAICRNIFRSDRRSNWFVGHVVLNKKGPTFQPALSPTGSKGGEEIKDSGQMQKNAAPAGGSQMQKNAAPTGGNQGGGRQGGNHGGGQGGGQGGGEKR